VAMRVSINKLINKSVAPVSGGAANTHMAPWFLSIRYLSMYLYSTSALAEIEFKYGAPFEYVLLILVNES